MNPPYVQTLSHFLYTQSSLTPLIPTSYKRELDQKPETGMIKIYNWAEHSMKYCEYLIEVNSKVGVSERQIVNLEHLMFELSLVLEIVDSYDIVV